MRNKDLRVPISNARVLKHLDLLSHLPSPSAVSGPVIEKTLDDIRLAYKIQRGTSGRTIILLHGYGADQLDLLPLGREFDKTATLVTLQAPYALDWSGYSWYHLSQTAQGLSGDEPSRMASLTLLLEALPRITQKESIDWSSVIVGGFSQGAAMSYGLLAEWAKTGETLPSALLAMSGYIPAPLLEMIPSAPLTGFPIFITHGTEDDLIPVQALHQAEQLLTEAGARVEARRYPIGHGISLEASNDIAEWLHQLNDN